MNEMGLKQKAVVAVLAVLALYAIAAGTWFFSAQQEWKIAAKKYATKQGEYRRKRDDVANREKWVDRYEAAKAAMPVFDVGLSTDTTWRQYVGDLATSNRVIVTRLDAAKEVKEEDVSELPITIDWQASLEALVRYVHALETSPRGMMDVRKLTISPIEDKPGYLRGQMTVNCAYMRAE